MRSDTVEVLKRVGYGAVAGLAGTMAMQVVRTASRKLVPSAEPPVREDPGKFILRKVEEKLPREMRRKIPEQVEAVGSTLLAVGYGATGAALYTAFRSEPAVLRDGVILGTAVWALGYLGWLPAMKLMPPVLRQRPQQIAMSVVQHALYGVATVSAFRKLTGALRNEV